MWRGGTWPYLGVGAARQQLDAQLPPDARDGEEGPCPQDNDVDGHVWSPDCNNAQYFCPTTPLPVPCIAPWTDPGSRVTPPWWRSRTFGARSPAAEAQRDSGVPPHDYAAVVCVAWSKVDYTKLDVMDTGQSGFNGDTWADAETIAVAQALGVPEETLMH